MELETMSNAAQGARAISTAHNAISQKKIADDDAGAAVIRGPHGAGLSNLQQDTDNSCLRRSFSLRQDHKLSDSQCKVRV